MIRFDLLSVLQELEYFHELTGRVRAFRVVPSQIDTVGHLPPVSMTTRHDVIQTMPHSH